MDKETATLYLRDLSMSAVRGLSANEARSVSVALDYKGNDKHKEHTAFLIKKREQIHKARRGSTA